jgi:hypothetical protein
MDEKGSTNTWLVAIVAIVAVVGLVVLYMNMGAGPAAPAGEQEVATGEAFALPRTTTTLPVCTTSQTVDADGDGYRVVRPGVACRLSTAADCNDANRKINPGMTDVCGNGVDENCDGRDAVCNTSAPPTAPVACADADGDGYQGSSPSGCAMTTALDCNDANAAVKPGAVEICGNGVDENCDGRDVTCPSCTDTDGGFRAGVGGTATGHPYAGSTYTVTFPDVCSPNGTLNESVCQPSPGGGYIARQVDYACETDPGLVCIDPDGYGGVPAYCGYGTS